MIVSQGTTVGTYLGRYITVIPTLDLTFLVHIISVICSSSSVPLSVSLSAYQPIYIQPPQLTQTNQQNLQNSYPRHNLCTSSTRPTQAAWTNKSRNLFKKACNLLSFTFILSPQNIILTSYLTNKIQHRNTSIKKNKTYPINPSPIQSIPQSTKQSSLKPPNTKTRTTKINTNSVLQQDKQLEIRMLPSLYVMLRIRPQFSQILRKSTEKPSQDAPCLSFSFLRKCLPTYSTPP